MASCRADGGQQKVEQIPLGNVMEPPSSPEMHPQCHKSSPQPADGEIGGETPCDTYQHLHNPDTSASDQTNLLALVCQERLPSLSRALDWKREQVKRLKKLLAEGEAELLPARSPVMQPSAQTALVWREVQAAKTRLVELQTMYEEEAALNAQLHEDIQQLTQRLEGQEARHTQDLYSMGERIDRMRLGVQLLEEHPGTEGAKAALEIICEGLREKVEFEKRLFQENITHAYNQRLVTLKALCTSDRLLVEQARSQRQQLQRCCEVLSDHADALRHKVQCEEAQCQTLAETFHQEHNYNQHWVRALEQRCQGLWQCLCEREPGQDVSVEIYPSSQAKETETEYAAVESRLAGEHWVQNRGASRDRRPHCAEGESEGTPGRSGLDAGRGLLDPAPSATESVIPQDLAAEEKQIAARPTGMEHQTLSRKASGVRIQQVDRRGRFVQLYNPSPLEPVDLGGCLLQQSVGVHPVSLYRFPRNTRLPPQDHLRVWAAVPDRADKRAADTVWNGLCRFRSGADCTTTLCRWNGQELAQYVPSHRFLAAADYYAESDDVSEVWVPPAQSTQWTSSTTSSQRQNLREDKRDSGPAATSTDLSGDRSDSARIPTEGERPESNTSSLSEWSCLWSQSSADSDIRNYVQSSLRSLPPDSLPALVTPASPSPRAMAPTSRPSWDLEGPTSAACALQLERIRSLTGRMTQRNAYPRFGLRFMSYPLITTDSQLHRR
ncbi:lamin-A-like [Pristis pectinata]|uniref:lamin-A-like n=1 Tax=Pristis pectinata TaxID=685728 RepID=UPI00223CFDFF|nr:lamin-A-like [Pristis pectinata]XP_051885357.1 lamin-A-like [Pristis pectinata]XP_051885358.1 lamin-A-like [Pristis pectinata]XP_051885359.1 lamin-A-like [Pristis pectinata]XP_051885360.1 lamin-A-like [Pristis pectinata]